MLYRALLTKGRKRRDKIYEIVLAFTSAARESNLGWQQIFLRSINKPEVKVPFCKEWIHCHIHKHQNILLKFNLLIKKVLQ